MSRFISLLGQRFGRMVVISDPGSGIVEIRCDCGVRKKISKYHVKQQKSCGCWKQEARRKHGMHTSSEYGIWEHIVQRCTNPQCDSYKNYGGRGIGICEEWRSSFAAFYRDLGARPTKHHTVERIDNDGHYAPGNCKWILKGEQSKNRRNLRFLTFQGKTQATFRWAEELGLSEKTIHTRLYRGWTDEQALSLRPQRGRKP